jgi:hypothetical protein
MNDAESSSSWASSESSPAKRCRASILIESPKHSKGIGLDVGAAIQSIEQHQAQTNQSPNQANKTWVVCGTHDDQLAG